MSWKRMIFGEKTPDKNDPQYKERYQKEVDAGRKTARFLKIDKLSAKIQTFASKRPKIFLALVVSVMIFCFCYNIFCIARVLSRPEHVVTATQIQRERLEKRKALDAEAKAKNSEMEALEPKSISDNTQGQDEIILDNTIECKSKDKLEIEDTNNVSQELEPIELEDINETEDFR